MFSGKYCAKHITLGIPEVACSLPAGHQTWCDVRLATSCITETIRKPPLVKTHTAFRKQKKIKYGEKRFSIWRMEFLHPAMWQVAVWWRAIEFAQTSAILEFYFWFRFRPNHRSQHVILHQSAKFYPNRTTLGRKNFVMSIFMMADLRHLRF